MPGVQDKEYSMMLILIFPSVKVKLDQRLTDNQYILKSIAN